MLADALCKNITLIYLDIQNNQFGSEEEKALASVSSKNADLILKYKTMNDCHDFTSKFSNIDIGSRNIVSHIEESISKIDVEKLEEYYINLAWSMDTKIYKSSQSQFEFFSKKISRQ